MQIYLVGGAVRDALMGQPIKDRDWVVVGSTPEQMQALGYVPVGRDFPVFLHPTSHEEYALARTERKTAPGYHGFVVHASPEVTLEEDLARRDLTVNAMAVPASEVHDEGFSQAAVIDPHAGRQHLGERTLRHVTPAFREDPVRILRLARFCARFADFSIASDTMQLMQDMVRDGEVDHLVAERVWQEIARGLMEARPSRMLEVLMRCGALQRLAPELLPSAAVLQTVDRTAETQAALPVRFACMVFGHAAALGARWRAPSDCVALSELLEREYDALQASLTTTAADCLALVERCDALRKPARFAQLLQAFALLAAQHEQAVQAASRLTKVLAAAQAVATKSIAATAMQTGASGVKVGEMIHAARLTAVSAALESATVF